MRLLLSASISIWMAGGCLLGCSNTASGMESEPQAQAVVANQSCHAKHFKNSQQPTGVPSFAPAPRPTMKDCPLVVNATAVTSKNSGQLPYPGSAPVSTLPLIEEAIVHSNTSLDVVYLPNRGHTHLHCCVFLI